jgi:uncharacterized protein YbjT (DUF2867 family)
MKIQVLGASGQLGSHFMKRIPALVPGAEVKGSVRNASSAMNCQVFNPFRDDWSSLGHCDVLINSIGIIREKGGYTFEQVHGKLTQLILENRHRIGNPRVLQISVLGADRAAESEFLHTKAVADELLLNEPDTAVIRPSIVCTPGTVMVKKLLFLKRISSVLHTLLLPRSFPGSKIQPVLAEDLCAVVAALCVEEQVSGIWNVTGPEEIVMKELLDLASGRELRCITLPDSFFRLAAALLPSLVSKEQLRLLQHDNIASNSRCVHLLGRPLQSTWSFWKQELS